jgi:hypothetical protein
MCFLCLIASLSTVFISLLIVFESFLKVLVMFLYLIFIPNILSFSSSILLVMFVPCDYFFQYCKKFAQVLISIVDFLVQAFFIIIIHMCIQGLGHLSPQLTRPPLPPTPPLPPPPQYPGETILPLFLTLL